MYARHAKRWLDFATAVALCALLAPLAAAVALGVFMDVGAPVVFRQRRPGLGRRTFVLLKFRTMTAARDASGELLPDESRLTKFGCFLRRTSLDELPTLWNVVRGEMSLVGPRPLLVEYLARYTRDQARRHEVKPGITGWAVVNGRNALSWDEKFAHDLWYVEHVSLWLDLKILAITAALVVSGKGVAAGGHATMPKFEGTSHGERRG